MKISQQQIDEILEMTTEQLLEIQEALKSVSDNLFVECVRYEIENRHRSENRECAHSSL